MTVGDFFVEYWFQFFVAIALIISTILVNTQGSINAKKKYNKMLPVFVMTVMWIIIRKVWINFLTHWKVPDIIYMILISTFFIFYFFMYYEKYFTPGFVIAQGCKGCYFTPPLKIGKYTVFNVGSSCKTFPIEQGDFLLVVPSDLVTFLGPYAFCNVQVTRRNIEKLPPYIKNHIKNEKNYNLNDVWFGRFDRKSLVYGEAVYKDYEGKEITPSEVQEELMNAYQVANTNQNFLDKDTRAIEDYVSSLDRVGKTLGKKSRIRIEDREEKEEYGP